MFVCFLINLPVKGCSGGTPCCMSDCHCAISGPGVLRLCEALCFYVNARAF